MRTALRALLVLGLGLAGCYYYTDPYATVGTLQVLWTFGGGQGCNQAGVNRVVVGISGGSYSFYCYDPVTGVPGATLSNVTAGTQGITLTGYSGSTPVYQSVGTVLIYGGIFNTYSFDLPYINTAPANSDITLLWSFGGKSCAQAGVANVNIFVTDPVGGNVNSTQPCTIDGAIVHSFSAGTYPFTLTGLGPSGQSLYRALGGATVNGVSPITVHVDLQPGVPPATGRGGTSVTLTFLGKTCAQAGVDQIYVDLRDLTGNIASQASVNCATFTSTISFGQLPAAATYYLDVVGSGAGVDGGSVILYQLLGEGITVQPSTNSIYTLDVPPT